VRKKIDGHLLKEFLEKCAEFWDIDQGKIVISPAFEIPTPMYFNYEMVDGIEYTIKVSEPVGQRIVSLTKDGRPVRDDDTFTLCIDNYRAAGGGGFDMLKGIPDIYHGQTSMVEILATYIMEHQNICFEEQNNIQVIV